MKDTTFGQLVIGDQFQVRNIVTEEVDPYVYTKVAPVTWPGGGVENATTVQRGKLIFVYLPDDRPVVKP